MFWTREKNRKESQDKYSNSKKKKHIEEEFKENKTSSYR